MERRAKNYTLLTMPKCQNAKGAFFIYANVLKINLLPNIGGFLYLGLPKSLLKSDSKSTGFLLLVLWVDLRILVQYRYPTYVRCRTDRV
jgi:hypothetical protein